MNSVKLNINKLHNPSDNRCSLILCKPKFKNTISESIRAKAKTIVLSPFRNSYVPLYFVKNNLPDIAKLVVNNSCGKPVAVSRILTLDLCKILGALCADGYISPRVRPIFKIDITDGDYTAIKTFCDWIKRSFGFECTIKRYAKIKAYRTWIANKIIGRYFVKVLEFPVGKKSQTVSMPAAVRKASLEFKKAFLQGLFTFDAGVNLNGNIEFLIRSKSLFNEVVAILHSLNVKFVYKHCPDKNGFYRFHTYRLNMLDLHKWLGFFEPHTEKWWKVYDLIHGYSKMPTSEKQALDIFEKVFPSKNRSLTNLSKVYSFIKLQKKLTIRELAEQLNIKGDTTIKYRELLKKCGIISEKTIKTRNSRIQILFNKDIKGWKIPWRPNGIGLQRNRLEGRIRSSRATRY